ncbi:hypothetical protein HZH68_013729 [Vespula germanica]|uniref:Uncharacterized protein n=1 Tax=Vespula germanica TaxID=30212 RepID=A0A834JBF4_VESGE|nr:hypothetical protein HZH68_013729 [Vespula germanica]
MPELSGFQEISEVCTANISTNGGATNNTIDIMARLLHFLQDSVESTKYLNRIFKMQALTRSRSCLECYRLPTSSTKMQDLSRKVVQPSDYIVGVDPLEKESRVVAALCVQQGFSMKAKEAFKDLGLLIIFPLVFDKSNDH